MHVTEALIPIYHGHHKVSLGRTDSTINLKNKPVFYNKLLGHPNHTYIAIAYLETRLETDD